MALTRLAVGGLQLDDLPEGQWRLLSSREVLQVFEGPTTPQVLAAESLPVA